MKLGLGLAVVARRRAGRYDGDDLSKGTLALDFLSVNEPIVTMSFVTATYQSWTDDPAWPYGTTGIFKAKG